MKRNLIILIWIVLCSCARDKSNGDVAVVEPGVDERSLKEWLTEHNLTEEQFTDTTGRRAFELWAYGDPIEKADSLMYWYPSTDSSYYLVSNFNCKDGSRLEEDWKDIQLRFHRSGTDDVSIGILLFDSLSKRSVDIYWADESSIYILEQVEENEYDMMLINMKHDSIWEFKTRKTKPQ